MKPLQVIALFVAALFIFGGLGLSAESGSNDPWALGCFVIGGLITIVTLFWRRKP